MYARSAVALLTLTLQMSVPEFITLRQLSKDALRTKFQLAPSCEPIVTAIRGVRTDMVVTVSCRNDDESGIPGRQRER
jgi:hypothetical protein